MESKFNIPEALFRIINEVAAIGGESYLVGGAVIDIIQGHPLKDWDVECYGISYERLNQLLSGFGNPNLVGRAFGIIKIRIDDIEYDFSIPRKDNCVGIGHRGFEIELIPELSIVDVARRRDLTINSISFNLIEQRLVDPFNGISDLSEGRLKATDPVTFVEDPLRVLRIMQLLPRKGKFVDPGTISLCRSIISEFNTLAKERIFEEFKKLLLKSERPSMGLQFLSDCGWIDHFPELKAMQGCPQNPEHHPEGDVWLHTLIVLDRAAKLKHHLPEEWKLGYMFGMLCHDIGKPEVTDPETLTSYFHEIAGVETTKRFLERITDAHDIIDKSSAIVKNHMRPFALFDNAAKESAWKRLHNSLPLHVAAYVCDADRKGLIVNDQPDMLEQAMMCLEFGEEFGMAKIPAILKGRHLIAHGLTPGPIFNTILNRAYEIQLETGSEDLEFLYSKAII